MRSFFDNVPEEYIPELRDVIQSMRETQGLLQHVRERYGTDVPDELRKKIGEEFDGVEVTEETIKELETLTELHEERRTAIKEVFQRIAGERGTVPPPTDDQEDED